MLIPFLLLFSFWNVNLGQEVGRVDIAGVHSAALPNPRTISYSPLGFVYDRPPLPPVLALRVVAAASSALELQLQNVGEADIQLPVSPDGPAVYSTCAKEPILSSFLSFRKSELAPFEVITKSELYGCATRKGSLITIKKGAWITLTGLDRGPYLQSNQEISLSYSLSRLTYESENLAREVGILRVNSR